MFVLSHGLFDRAPGELKTKESLRYASPEELNGIGRQSTTWVWVLGIFIYEFVYGRHPYEHKDTAVIRTMILKYPPPFPEHI
jgi:serine/threonine protein kinase